MAETDKQRSQRLICETMLRDALASVPSKHLPRCLPDLLAERFDKELLGGATLDVGVTGNWKRMLDLGHRICRKADELERAGRIDKNRQGGLAGGGPRRLATGHDTEHGWAGRNIADIN